MCVCARVCVQYTAANRSQRANEGAVKRIVGTGKYCLAHLSPVVKDNDGALLVIHWDCAHISLPWGQGEQPLGLRWEMDAVIYLPAAHWWPISHVDSNGSVPSESTDAVLSMSPARVMAREDFPTPFCPSRAILKGPSGLHSTVTVGVSSKAGLNRIGEAEGPATPDVQSQSSWTASSRLSWCLIGRGVLPLRTVGVLDRVILSTCRGRLRDAVIFLT